VTATSELTAPSTPDWAGWTAAERESFFDAIARHRRAAWRVTFATRAINFVVALIVAILMSPLFYGALALLLDVINLVVPAPNLAAKIGHVLQLMSDAPQKMSAPERLRVAFLAALPGLIWMALVLNALRRVLSLCMAFDSSELAARPPNPMVLAEQRFANVVAEMAIAANLPAPRVFVVDSPVVDAVALGLDEHHSTIAVSQGLLNLLNRAQMEGVAANLIAAIADGDMRIGVRAALSLSLFALIARLGNAVTEDHARRNVVRLVTAILLPTKASGRRLLAELTNPLRDESGERKRRPPSNTRWDNIRPYLWMPLAGPLVITGFFGALFNLFVLGPLLSLAWRQRKYMADATAVRLTRDPGTLAGALEQMTHARGAPLAAWAAHMSVAGEGRRQSGIFGANAVPMFPSIERRLRALAKMGAQVQPTARRKMPLYALLIIGPLLTLMVFLVAALFPLLILLSMMLTMLFTGLPFAVLHLLLRFLGHH
jgi:Zn-dependent protease with chaperone function